MNTPTTRISKYAYVSNTLTCMGNKQLCQLLSTGTAMHAGIGGTSFLKDIANIPVFIKQIPLTAIELELDNFMSTANLFKLPMCYQYGIGSSGFSAWRELAAHIMTTNWILSGQCPNFPLLYGWRVIPNLMNVTESLPKNTFENIDYWENNQNIAERLYALEKSETSILLFLEYFPKNLNQHLKEICSSNYSELKRDAGLEKLYSQFERVLGFMHEQGFLHMDAHFRNVLVDTDNLYLSDFGLALSDQFDLTIAEKQFLEVHRNYDRLSFSVNLLHGIITALTDDTNWDRKILDYTSGKLVLELPEKISKKLFSHAPIAKTMHSFYREIQKDKSTPYPFNALDLLLKEQISS